MAQPQSTLLPASERHLALVRLTIHVICISQIVRPFNQAYYCSILQYCPSQRVNPLLWVLRRVHQQFCMYVYACFDFLVLNRTCCTNIIERISVSVYMYVFLCILICTYCLYSLFIYVWIIRTGYTRHCTYAMYSYSLFSQPAPQGQLSRFSSHGKGAGLPIHQGEGLVYTLRWCWDQWPSIAWPPVERPVSGR